MDEVLTEDQQLLLEASSRSMEEAFPLSSVRRRETEDPMASASYLNDRMPSIAGGTKEMQRNGIGERVLALPREPSFDSTKPFSEVVRDARNWSGKVS